MTSVKVVVHTTPNQHKLTFLQDYITLDTENIQLKKRKTIQLPTNIAKHTTVNIVTKCNMAKTPYEKRQQLKRETLTYIMTF